MLQAAGHTVRLIPPQHVKPFVKRDKNDRNDAEAISEAARHPAMRFVPVKAAEPQAQAAALSVRELLARQQTQLINALRGHASEFAAAAAQGPAGLATLRAAAALVNMPQAARDTIEFLGQQIDRLHSEIASLDTKVSRLLADIPGIGPIGALTLALRIYPSTEAQNSHGRWRA